MGPLDALRRFGLPGRNGRLRRPGIRIHRPRQFDESLATSLRGIPVTNVKRTLRDVRLSVPPSIARRAVRAAEVGGCLTDELDSDRTRDDRDRDLELAGLGLTVHRFADSRIGDKATGVGATTARLLGLAAGSRGDSWPHSGPKSPHG